MVLNEKSTANWIAFPLWGTLFFFFFWLLWEFCVCLVFSSLIMMCPGVNFFEFILSGVCWASWFCWFMHFSKFGKFQSIFFHHRTPPFDFDDTDARTSALTHRSLRLCSLFKSSSLLFRLGIFYWSVSEFTDSFFFIISILLLSWSVKFCYFNVLFFRALIFIF